MNEQLVMLLAATRFQPFIIRVSDGEPCEVKHLENLAVDKHFMGLVEPGTDSAHDLYLLHVGAFERKPRVPSWGGSENWMLFSIGSE
jgi:hypothetical protein